MNTYNKSKKRDELLHKATQYGIRGIHGYTNINTNINKELIQALQMYENNPEYDELKKNSKKRGALLFQLLLYLELFKDDPHFSNNIFNNQNIISAMNPKYNTLFRNNVTVNHVDAILKYSLEEKLVKREVKNGEKYFKITKKGEKMLNELYVSNNNVNEHIKKYVDMNRNYKHKQTIAAIKGMKNLPRNVKAHVIQRTKC